MRDAVPPTTPQPAIASPRGRWTTPRLTELPKLTALTLASEIGGGGGTGGGGSTVFGLLFALLTLAGCSADRGTGPSDGLPAPVKMQAVTCQVTLADRRVACGGPATAGGQEIVGGQGQYVVLRSTNVTSAGGLFSADISVQNLGAQPIGTDDGINATGLYVFFASGPSVTGGSGNVALSNATGTADFTATGQSYFAYDTILGGLDESAPLTWEWTYDVGVTSFAFTVLVAADVPELGGALIWRPVEGMVSEWVQVVAANSPTDVMALGGKLRYHRRTGAGWTSHPQTLRGEVFALTALGSGQYAGVGSEGSGSYIARFNGSVWSTARTFADVELNAIHGTGPGSIAAGGFDHVAGAAFLSVLDGVTWRDTVIPAIGAITVIDARLPGDFVAATSNGALLRWDGDAWQLLHGIPADPTRIRAIEVDVDGGFYFGGSVDHGGDDMAFVAHDDGVQIDTILVGPEGTVQALVLQAGEELLAQVEGEEMFTSYTLFRNWSGSSWVTVDSIGIPLGPMVPDGSGIYLLPAFGSLGSWDGAGVDLEFAPSAGEQEFNGVAAVGDHVYVTDQEGNVHHYDGTTWETTSVSGSHLQGVWAFATNDVYAGGDEGMFHYDGATWTQIPLAEVGEGLVTLWGTGSTLFAAKSDTVFVLSGGVWTAHHDSFVSGNYFTAIWGTGPTDVYFAGYPYGVRHFDGATWSDHVLPARAPGDSSFWTEALGGTSGSDLWLGTDDAGLLHFDGVAVTPLGGLDLGTVGGILPLGPGRAWVTTSDGAFLAVPSALIASSNGGLNGDVGLVSTPSGLLVAVGSGGVYFGGR